MAAEPESINVHRSDRRREEVRLAEEVGDELGDGPVVELGRRSRLLDPPVAKTRSGRT